VLVSISVSTCMFILYRAIWGTIMEDNVLAEVGIEHGTFGNNARCYNHYNMVAFPVPTSSGRRSYPKKVLADNI
jgi:hypothetical protein